MFRLTPLQVARDDGKGDPGKARRECRTFAASTRSAAKRFLRLTPGSRKCAWKNRPYGARLAPARRALQKAI